MAHSDDDRKIHTVINYLIEKSIYSSRRKVYLEIIKEHGGVSETLVRECDFQRRASSRSLLKSASLVFYRSLHSPFYLDKNFLLYLPLERIEKLLLSVDFISVPTPLGVDKKNINRFLLNSELITKSQMKLFFGNNYLIYKEEVNGYYRYFFNTLKITLNTDSSISFNFHDKFSNKYYEGFSYLRDEILFFRGFDEVDNSVLLMQFPLEKFPSNITQGFQIVSNLNKPIQRIFVLYKLNNEEINSSEISIEHLGLNNDEIDSLFSVPTTPIKPITLSSLDGYYFE